MDLSNGKLTSLLQSCLFGSLCILLNGCLGGGGGGGGTSSTFLDESTTYTYNASTDTTWRARQEYKNVAQYLSDSTIHPYTLIGVNKAYGRGLSGSGKTIAILDTKFTGHTHADFKSKDAAGKMSTYGSLALGGSYHGIHVSGIAAGDYNGNSSTYIPDNTAYTFSGGSYSLLNYSMMGVAYNAALHWSDFSKTSSGSTRLHLANATSAAKTAGAIVQNNSWAFKEALGWTIDVFKDYQTNNGTTDSATYASYVDTAANWATYASALDSFQSTGVIVRAAGNDTSKSEVDANAGMPLLFSELAEAWLVVGNLDTSGSTVTASSVTRKGNQCGLAAAFCVYADGTDITAPIGGYKKADYEVYSGTSMAAPMVSGSIALLSEAFPNHTPAQLVDRILASANNDFYTTTGTTSFAGGITHGYNSEFGHGLVDLGAALSPIQTSSMVPPSGPILSGPQGNINSAKRFNLSATKVNLGTAFGDSLHQSLNKRTAYFYDGLNGGFAFNFGSLVGTSTKRKMIKYPVDYISRSPRVKTAKASLGFTVMSSTPSAPEARDGGFLMLLPASKETTGFAGQNINIQNALSFSENNGGTTRTIESGNPFSIPFISASEKGSVAGIRSGLFAGNLSLGIFNSDRDKHQLPTSGFIASYEVDFDSSKISAFSGTTMENDGFLETSIEGAFAEKSIANTRFAGLSARGKLPGRWLYNVMGTFGHTDLEIKGVGLLDNVKDVYSTAFALEFQRPIGLAKNDMLYFGISQPIRVETGTASIHIPQLYGVGGMLNFNKESYELKPSGRQLDFGMGYRSSLYEGVNVGLQTALTQDAGHVRSNGVDYSIMGYLKSNF
jgi:subtilase-type serine protease